MADIIGSGRSIAAATTAMQLMAAPVAVLQIVHFNQFSKTFNVILLIASFFQPTEPQAEVVLVASLSMFRGKEISIRVLLVLPVFTFTVVPLLQHKTSK